MNKQNSKEGFFFLFRHFYNPSYLLFWKKKSWWVKGTVCIYLTTVTLKAQQHLLVQKSTMSVHSHDVILWFFFCCFFFSLQTIIKHLNLQLLLYTQLKSLSEEGVCGRLHPEHSETCLLHGCVERRAEAQAQNHAGVGRVDDPIIPQSAERRTAQPITRQASSH